MKTKILITLAIVAVSVSAFGQSLTSLFDLSRANGSTNGAATSSSYRIPTEVVFIQIGAPGITNVADFRTNVVSGVTNIINTRTNIARASKQVSFDGSNWTTVDTGYPTGTNAGIFNWSPSNNITLYTRVVVFTSNSIPVGVMKQ